ncbi:MAG TPA: hypothetical protein VK163_12575 [Opitutaceae bacterium]|nr:hypothetical protein [Opitutaceae bacterium]
MSDAPVPPPPAPAAPAGEDKTVAILAYVTPWLCGIGFVIAVLMHNKAKTRLGAFHLRQMLGLLIVGVALWLVTFVLGFVLAFAGGIPVVGFILTKGFSLLSFAAGLGLMILWVLGLVGAVNEEQKPVPVLGKLIQEKLAGVFA